MSIKFPKGGVLPLKPNEPIILGRGEYGISAAEISRRHLSITKDNNDRVMVKTLSTVNPSYIWKKGAMECTSLRTNEEVEVFDGDKVSLLFDSHEILIIKNNENKSNQTDHTSEQFMMKSPERTPSPYSRSVSPKKRKAEREASTSPKRQKITRKKKIQKLFFSEF